MTSRFDKPFLHRFRQNSRHRDFFGVVLAILLLGGCGGESGDGIDPGIIEVPLAYIERPIPLDEDGNEIQPDLRDPRFFAAGGDVYYRTNSALDGETFNLTRAITLGRGDVKGLNGSYDGRRLIFSLRLEDPDPDDDVVPSWNIYEYDLDLRELRQVLRPDHFHGAGIDRIDLNQMAEQGKA